MSARNRQLVATLAVTRYLSTQQISRLFFPERYGTSCLRRLAQLSGRARLGNFEPALLRKLQFRVYGGGMVDIWGLTDSGYAIAEEALGAELTIPRKDVGAEYRQHCIALNDLFVGLALPYLRAGWRVSRLPFFWSPSESVRLPWTEYDAKENKRYDRLVIPDAVLEVRDSRRRIFVECEMGTHSIVAASDRKAGATIAKAEAYEEFLFGVADAQARETFYAKAYPDRWSTEVLFLVRTPHRKSSVNAALSTWRRGRAGPALTTRAVIEEDVIRDLAAVLPDALRKRETASSRVVLGRQDVETLKRFYQESLRTLQDALGRLKEKPGSALSEAAANAKEVLTRLGGSAAERTSKPPADRVQRA